MNEDERNDLREDPLPNKSCAICACDVNCREGMAVVSNHDDSVWGRQMARGGWRLYVTISRGMEHKEINGDPDMK